jgi:predicted DNA binding CopG/RHH family protein
MASSSINVQGVKGGSEQHNEREKDLDYVKKELSHLNSSYKTCTVAEAKVATEKLYVEKVGQKLQEKTALVREGVLLVENHHTIEDLKNLGVKLEEAFGIKTLQIYIHKDEGHTIDGKWKPNLHAHMVFDWQDKQTGKSIKLGRQQMSQMQTITAESLGMERGVPSDVKHLNAVQFKVQAEEQRLIQAHGLDNSLEKLRKEAERRELLEKENQALEAKIEALKVESSLQKMNIEYLKKQEQVLEKSIEEKKEKKQGRGI